MRHNYDLIDSSALLPHLVDKLGVGHISVPHELLTDGKLGRAVRHIKYHSHRQNIIIVGGASLRMKRLTDDTEELVRMLDLNNMINEYMGKRKPVEEPKPTISMTRPLLVFDLNLNMINLPRPAPQRSS